MEFLRKNIYWISFVSVFILGFLVILGYCFMVDGTTLKDIKLDNWLRYFAGSGTVGGFWYLILDKTLNDSKRKHLEWQERIPFITLGSPCSPLTSYCEINILEDYDDNTGRGNEYFRVSNLGKINAYNLKFKFCSSADFINSNIFNRHFIPYLPPFSEGISEGIFSNFNINPDTKEISNSEFKICNCLVDCAVSNTSNDEKRFFVRIEYNSSLDPKFGNTIKSEFQVDVICTKIEILQPVGVEPVDKKNMNKYKDCVYIKGIQLINYEYK